MQCSSVHGNIAEVRNFLDILSLLSKCFSKLSLSLVGRSIGTIVSEESAAALSRI
jgi:hypothetical protein